jgi:hypothetical protein
MTPVQYFDSVYWKAQRVPSNQVPGADTYVPTCIKLSSTIRDQSYRSDGADIVVTDVNGNLIPRSIVSFGKSNDNIMLWYRDPAQDTINGGTEVYIQWGGSSVNVNVKNSNVWTNAWGGTATAQLVALPVSGQTSLIDYSLNNSTITQVGSPAQVATGPLGRSFRFTGGSWQRFTIPHLQSMRGGNGTVNYPWTMIYSRKLDNIISPIYFGMKGNSDATYDYWTHQSSNGNLSCVQQDGSASHRLVRSAVSSGVLDEKTLFHTIASVCPISNLNTDGRIYYDGTQVDSTGSRVGNFIACDGDADIFILLNPFNNAGYWFNGDLSNMMWVNKELSTEQVTFQYRVLNGFLTDDLISSSDEGNFNAPFAPVLISPVSGSINQRIDILNLDWSDVSLATTYRLFVDSLLDLSGIAISEYDLSGLLYNTLYSWRVNAYNNSVSGDLSETWTFTTDVNPIPPNLTSPISGEVLYSLPLLLWETVPGVYSYTLEIAESPSFDSLVYSTTVTKNYYQTVGISYGTYYWRVRSNNTYESGSWSDIWSFIYNLSEDEYIFTNKKMEPNPYISKCINLNYVGAVGSYNNERELFDVLVTEAYNKHGICMDYYVTSYNTSYNKVWGEDNDRRFIRKFQIMTYFTLPREEKLWSKFGIEALDSFSLYVSKRHFWKSSKYDDQQLNSCAFDPYIPKAGDYLYSKYNKYLYEIVEVKDEVMMNLLSKQHVWEFMVEPFKDEKIATDILTSASPISAFTNQQTDKFNISDDINNKKLNVNYNQPSTECDPNDPFGNW